MFQFVKAFVKVSTLNRYFFHDPGLARLDDATLLIAAPQWGRAGSDVQRCLKMRPSDDGEDLVVLSRASRDSGDRHDADLCTIHRVCSFGDLGMDLRKGSLHLRTKMTSKDW